MPIPNILRISKLTALMVMAILASTVASCNAQTDSSLNASSSAPSGAEPPTYAVVPRNAERLAREANGTRPVYLTDDRMEFRDKDDAMRSPDLQARLKASPALVAKGRLTLDATDKHRFKAQGRAIVDNGLPLCKDERFAEQTSLAFCSGTLVAKDVILTAGHCVRELSGDGLSVSDIRVVFGYYIDSDPPRVPGSFRRESVFNGRRFLDGELSNTKTGLRDWALIALDRDVPSEIASPVLDTGTPNKEAQIYAVGYPSGLPLKYAPNGQITGLWADQSHFVANVDTFAGNSGSGIYDQTTHRLVGVLSGGHSDYYKDEGANCLRAYECGPNGCSGEHMMRVDSIRLTEALAASAGEAKGSSRE